MPETRSVDARQENDIAILATDGYLNDAAAEDVAKAGHGLVDEGAKHLVLNLEKSPIANSIGISVLIELIERVREGGGRSAFCCAAPILAKTLKIMGLLEVAVNCGRAADVLAAAVGSEVIVVEARDASR